MHISYTTYLRYLNPSTPPGPTFHSEMSCVFRLQFSTYMHFFVAFLTLCFLPVYYYPLFCGFVLLLLFQFAFS